MFPLVVYSSTGTLLVLLVYHYVIYPTFLSPLSKIPKAHITCSFLPLWIRWYRRGGREGLHAILAAHEKHGPIVRLAPNEVHVASPEAVQAVYSKGFPKDRSYVDLFINYNTPNLSSTLEYGPHKIQRRMLAHVYAKSYIQNSPDMKTLSKVLIFD